LPVYGVEHLSGFGGDGRSNSSFLSNSHFAGRSQVMQFLGS
jgi:hypothetical protein